MSRPSTMRACQVAHPGVEWFTDHLGRPAYTARSCATVLRLSFVLVRRGKGDVRPLWECCALDVGECNGDAGAARVEAKGQGPSIIFAAGDAIAAFRASPGRSAG